MSDYSEDNPPAFPLPLGGAHDQYAEQRGMTLRDWFATFAPKPDQYEMERERKLDRARNPNNDPYHHWPQFRSDKRIIADLAYAHADEMLKAREVIS